MNKVDGILTAIVFIGLISLIGGWILLIINSLVGKILICCGCGFIVLFFVILIIWIRRFPG